MPGLYSDSILRYMTWGRHGISLEFIYTIREWEKKGVLAIHLALFCLFEAGSLIGPELGEWASLAG